MQRHDLILIILLKLQVSLLQFELLENRVNGFFLISISLLDNFFKFCFLFESHLKQVPSVSFSKLLLKILGKRVFFNELTNQHLLGIFVQTTETR